MITQTSDTIKHAATAIHHDPVAKSVNSLSAEHPAPLVNHVYSGYPATSVQSVSPAQLAPSIEALDSVTQANEAKSPDTLKVYYKEHFASTDSTEYSQYTTSQPSGFEGTQLPYILKSDDGITGLLLFCFFLSSYVLSKGKKYLAQQIKDFSLTNERERNSIFAGSTASEFRHRLLLLLQTCILLGICFFEYFHDRQPSPIAVNPPYVVLGIYIATCVVFYLLKGILFRFILWVFFDKNMTKLCLESYTLLICLLGLSLFPLTLLVVYFDLPPSILLPIGLILIIFTKILMFYKWLKFFFNNLYGLLCLIVYFCALELMPCLILYQGIVQLNNILQIKL